MADTNENVLIPTNDYFARYLFADVGSERILLHFLNALRKDANQVPFKTVELLDTFNLKENVLERETVVDVKARTETDEIVIVEVQNIANAGYISRVLYYIAVSYAKQVNIAIEHVKEKKSRKIDYTSLKPIISVSLLNCNIHVVSNKIHSVFRMKEITTGYELSKDWEVHFIELKKEVTSENKDLELWIKFFTSKNLEEDKMEIVSSNPIFEEVYERYEKFSGDVELMEKYRDLQAYYMTQEHMFEVEREQGRSLGIQEGLEEGRAEGLTQGKNEANIQTARIALQKGFTITEISELTGLSEEEIKLINNK